MYRMNTDTLISMMLAPVLIKMVEPVVSWILSVVRSIYKWMTNLFTPASVELSSKQYVGKITIANSNERYMQLQLITEITTVLARKGCVVREGRTRCLNHKKLDISALGPVYYKGFTFIFSDNTYMAAAELPCIETKLTIKHRRADKIRSFIDKCSERIARASDASFDQMYYGQTKTTEGYLAYNALTFKPTTTFDDVFFGKKPAVVASIDMLLAGKIPKLSFFLHGEPGCGKSSLVKAIAAKTGYSLVEIKLSFVENDNELRNIVFNNKLPITTFGEHGGSRYVDVSRRIYLFEDIDAECTIVHHRDLQKEMPESIDLSLTTDKDDKTPKINTKRQKLTLSGILNVLDGILAISGSIVVMTTNHPEKLDPALVRFGRVTHNIQMGKLTDSDAARLVKKFHPGWSGVVPGDRYTPAELEAICQTNTLDGVNEVLSAEVVA